MTAATNLIADVIGYLVAQCQASPALQALDVTVVDGPNVAGTLSGIEQVLWIGHNPKQVDEEAGQAEQGFAFLATEYRDESGSVTCCAKHWSGDTTFAVHREYCKQIIGAVELMLRGDDAQGGPGDSTMGGLVQWGEFTETTWWQSLADGGGEALCSFKITYFARLASS